MVDELKSVLVGGGLEKPEPTLFEPPFVPIQPVELEPELGLVEVPELEELEPDLNDDPELDGFELELDPVLEGLLELELDPDDLELELNPDDFELELEPDDFELELEPPEYRDPPLLLFCANNGEQTVSSNNITTTFRITFELL